MAPASPVRPGEVIADKYRVRGVIGHGGVGVVVAADHLTLERPVALKFLRPELAHEPEVVRRFLREARASAQLRSEHVARVMDADSIPGGPAFLVMELLDGRDLSAVVREDGPLPVLAAVDYVMQACDAVAEAHARGIIHRDIKSSNLFLTRTPEGAPLVKVLDFGLSKFEHADSRASLTSANQVIGSPHFMSPEQMRSSREADARTDIWALGAVLYTFLAGRVPFEGAYLTEVCAAVLSGAATPITTLRPDVPARLADVIARCLKLEPADRFQSVAELVQALADHASPGPQVSAPPDVAAPTPVAHGPLPATARRTRLRWSAALACAALAGATVLLLRRPPPAVVAAAVAAAPQAVVAAVTPPPAPSVDPPSTSEPGAGEVAPRPRPQRRHVPAGGWRRNAVSAPASAPSSKPRSEDSLILGLPH